MSTHHCPAAGDKRGDRFWLYSGQHLLECPHQEADIPDIYVPLSKTHNSCRALSLSVGKRVKRCE